MGGISPLSDHRVESRRPVRDQTPSCEAPFPQRFLAMGMVGDPLDCNRSNSLMHLQTARSYFSTEKGLRNLGSITADIRVAAPATPLCRSMLCALEEQFGPSAGAQFPRQTAHQRGGRRKGDWLRPERTTPVAKTSSGGVCPFSTVWPRSQLRPAQGRILRSTRS